ncbi:MAG: peptidylprolyl isomerase [Gammaproteobacteria bacterium]|nr:peptidylprolyl isomerase [Gammaproteobacteria bacterium]
MRNILITLTSLFLLFSSANAAEDAASKRVKLETSEGNIILELDMTRAPLTVVNFLKHVNSGYYDGTIFHRVIQNFMIQGGGFNAEMNRKEGNATVLNEADNGLSNLRGTIAMARTNDPHSASAQFFINVVDNTFLDHKNKTPRGWGYAVFGHVVKGMNVVDKIRNMRTGPNGPFPTDVPLKMVIIHKASVIEAAKNIKK